MLAESSNETSLFLDKSSRISKPPLGQLIFEELLTPEGEGLAKVCWSDRGEKADAGICSPVAPG